MIGDRTLLTRVLSLPHGTESTPELNQLCDDILAHTRDITCSFCGKGLKDVRKMVKSPSSAFICNACVVESVKMLVNGAIGPLRTVYGDKAG